MDFKKGMFIDETTLNEYEAAMFVKFLQSEKERHQRELYVYKALAEQDSTDKFMRVVAMTVVLRHIDDIEHTDKTINYLREKFGW